MNLTIGKQLGLGFGILIALMIVGSTITYVKVNESRKIESRVLDLRYPTVLAGRELANGMNHSLAGLRGYMILGTDPQKAEFFKGDRTAAWEEIDTAVAKMDAFAKTWTDPTNVDRLATVKQELEGFRVAQQEVENISHTDKNIPSFNILLTEAAPRAGKMLAAVTAIINEESKLEATAERKALLGNLADTRGSFAVGLANIRANLLSGDEKFRTIFDGKWTINEKVYKVIQGKLNLFTATQRKQWDIYAAQRKEFAPLPSKMFASRSSKDWNLANYWLGTKAAPRARAIQAVLTELADSQRKLMANDLTSLKAAATSQITTLIAAASLAAVFGVIVALILTRRIVSALMAMIGPFKEIAQGDLTQRVDEQRKDELGELGKWFNKLVQSLHDIITEVSGSTTNVASAATEIAASSEEMAAGMGEQTQQVMQISSAIEQMSASVIEVAKKSTSAATTAKEFGEVAQQGGEVVNQTIEGMESINEAVSASATSVQELGKRGEQIGQIIDVINDIADQTNLLALNAAIEAARAGEHGRGFAVVADEVRKLADRTTKATEEIGESIKAIQTETGDAVNRMNTGTEQVGKGVELAMQAGENLQRIVSGAKDVASMIQSIASATDQQSSASELISQNVESISAVSRQASEGASQAASAASQLSQRAEQLQRLIGQFKITENKATDEKESGHQKLAA